MSRYPFMEYAEKYMESMRGVIADITWNNTLRRYRRMERDVIALKEKKVISTVSPKSMTIEDVKQYLIYRKSLNNGVSEMRHEISALRSLFAFIENPNLELCIARNPILVPSGKNVRLPSMPESTYNAILERSKEIDPEDWRRVRAYTLVLLCIRTGGRNKEIRLADACDLDTKNWVLNLIHVKGEDTYGGPRTVPVHPDVRPILTNYLRLRQKWLGEFESTFIALFPSKESADGHLSSNSMRVIKSIVEKEIGTKFDLRMCRRTFGQQYVNAGVKVESVSVLMGHASTKTTEHYYCRKSQADAIEDAQNVW